MANIYIHRLAYFNQDLTAVELSKPFRFKHEGIEFCAGLARFGGRLIASFGVDDREAWLAEISDVTVEQMFGRRVAGPHVAVCHSPHERCGIREYGSALDDALTEHINVLSSPEPSDLISGDVLLIHYEPALVRDKTRWLVDAAKSKGVKVIFCCHWFGQDVLDQWGSKVDRFVVHRNYGIGSGKVVEIPLACPVYEPTASVSEIRTRFGLPQDRLILTTVGFLAYWKKLPELAQALSRVADQSIFVNFQTPLPFKTPGDAEPRLREAMKLFPAGSSRLSTDFLSPQDLTDLVYASDLGFVYHPSDTGSVSAATKQFVSARCPVVINSSSHSSDIHEGVERVAGFDVGTFAGQIASMVRDQDRLKELREQMVREYERINMKAVALKYIELFKELP